MATTGRALLDVGAAWREIGDVRCFARFDVNDGTKLELGAGVATDEGGMQLALAAAREARARDEVPVGAVVVLDGRVIGVGWNGTRTGKDPTAHAEVIAIRQAAKAVGAQRMPGATLYCTVEPCFMCAGAASHARVARIVFAIRDPKFGACGSLGDVPGHPSLNHRSVVSEGLCADEARALMVEFFREKRRAARGESDSDSLA